MNAKRGLAFWRGALAILAVLATPSFAAAQGFAGLGAAPEGFAVPSRATVLQFPADHGAHPDFRIEWWYLTANLTGPDGTAYGLQWTLFRSALAPQDGTGWSAPQVWMGHAAVTTPTAHFVAETLARGGIGQAGATATPFAAWIDDWEMASVTPDDADLTALRLTASGTDFAYDVQLQATGPLVLHGEAGYSVKSAAGQASHYYSQPNLQVSGTLTLPTGPVAVTGNAWLDREWSTQPLAQDQRGWDWFSLSFDSGEKLMGFVLQGTQPYTAATWISADGQATAIPNGAFSATALSIFGVQGEAGILAEVPVEWRVQLPSRGVDVVVSALNPNAWMATSVPYWEGPVTVTGSHSGVGYLEMTGYDAN